MASDGARLRTTLSAFDERQKKIVGGMISVMIQNPERVREREWIVEQFTHLTLLAGDFEEVDSVDHGMTVVQEYVRDHIDALMNASFELFGQVARDMKELPEEERDKERAVAQALSYF